MCYINNAELRILCRAKTRSLVRGKSLIKTTFESFQSLIEELKQLHFKKLIAVVPPDLKAQFEQMQLKNSLCRLKLFGAITVLFNLLNWPIYILRADEINPMLFQKIFIADLSQFFITLLFFVLTGYFSKKGRHYILMFLCYSFIALHFVLSVYSMLYVEIFLVLQTFFTGAFLYTFAPDFRPKIFISYLVLYYLISAGLLTYKNHSFIFGGPQVFTLNIFFIALLIKIFLYNGNVRKFIDKSRISALNEKLEALSMTDELTKLNNRRSFLEYMNTIWVLSRRLQTPVNVLMIDVDYFKKYNDSLGHLEGDKAIIAIAQCMKNEIRRGADFVARFGGEEFVCLLPFLEKDDALNLAKNLVQRIEQMEIPHPMSESSKYVTVSIGFANTIPDDNNSQTQLLHEADKALYTAKQSGRNMVAAG
jgi:diguanylate cyclase (GGDEF)-like protein